VASDEFSPEKYKDEVKERVLELIQHKVDGEDITITPEAPKGEIIDLMEALKASLGTAGAERKPARAAPRKKAASPDSKKKKAKSSKS